MATHRGPSKPKSATPAWRGGRMPLVRWLGTSTAPRRTRRLTATTSIHSSILDRIGSTPLVELRSIVPAGSARILLKIESENPTGSMKDRMALAMIEAAERDGRLKSGGNVVEYTGGSTGVSLALICAAKKYPLHIVTSDAFSLAKRDHMRALGAELTIVKSENGGMDAALTRHDRNGAAGARADGRVLD